MEQACIKEINNIFFPALDNCIANEIDKNLWSLKISENDPQTILFYYPRLINVFSADYIQPVIKIEMGARSDDWPTVNGTVISFIEETFKDVFPKNLISIKTLSCERTFWEKVTILHAEHYRPTLKNVAVRSSRHYYDVYQMYKKGAYSNALSQMNLLERVAKHKSVFFRSSWAKYEEAQPGTLRIIPKLERISELKQDYIKMKEMFFAKPPSFDEIINALNELENSINMQMYVTV